MLFLIFIPVAVVSCSKSKDKEADRKLSAQGIPLERKKRFTGNYNREFNDLQDLHMEAALQHGISPLEHRGDTAKFKKKDLVRLPPAMELYKTYQLTHSIPYLVPSAAKLFVDITHNFRDSLYSKELPLYRLYLTSVLRTDEDVKKLTRNNINASENSVHRYATTFDISWKRFEQVIPDSTSEVMPERLKLVLAQVLFDLKEQERCFVKHERQQACFHITVR